MADELFEIRNAPNGKGRGLFTKQAIVAGTVIFQETVLAIFLGDVIKSLHDWHEPEVWQALVGREEQPGENHGQIGRLVREYIAEASAEGYDIDTILMARAHPDFENQYVDVFLTNRLGSKYGNHQTIGLGRHASIINHSCISNAHLRSSDQDCPPNRQKAYVKATKFIAQGQAITITYLGVSDWEEERRKVIALFFKFNCSCDVCSKGDEDREILLHKCYLADAIIAWGTEDSLANRAPWAFFRSAWTICCAFVNVGVTDWRAAQIMMDCAEVAVHHSDAVRARHFWMSVETWHRLANHDNCEALQWFATLIKEPQLHREWGKSTLGMSGPEYDPIREDYKPAEATIKLLFMMDYQTNEYRGIALGADRKMSAEARAQLKESGQHYAELMEKDAAEAAAKQLLVEENEEERREAAKLEKARKKRAKDKEKKRVKKERMQEEKETTVNHSDDGQNDVVESSAVKNVQENNRELSSQPALGITDIDNGGDGWTTVQKDKGKEKTKTNTRTDLAIETRGIEPPATSPPTANNPPSAIHPPTAPRQQPTIRQRAAQPANRQPPVAPTQPVHHRKPTTRATVKMTKQSVVTASSVVAPPPAAASSPAASPPPAITPLVVLTGAPAAGPSTNNKPPVVDASFVTVAPGAENVESTNQEGTAQSSDTTTKVHNLQGPIDSLNDQGSGERSQTHGQPQESESNYAMTVTEEGWLQTGHFDDAEAESMQNPLSVEERTIAAFLDPSVPVLPIITSYRPRAQSGPPRLVTPPNRNNQLHAEIHSRLALLQRLRLYAAEQMEEVNQLQLQLE